MCRNRNYSAGINVLNPYRSTALKIGICSEATREPLEAVYRFSENSSVFSSDRSTEAFNETTVVAPTYGFDSAQATRGNALPRAARHSGTFASSVKDKFR